MPCERLFSATKQIATDCRARLGAGMFEKLAIMRSAWGPKLFDAAALNSMQVEEVNLPDFEDMLADDIDMPEWDKNQDESNDIELVV